MIEDYQIGDFIILKFESLYLKGKTDIEWYESNTNHNPLQKYLGPENIGLIVDIEDKNVKRLYIEKGKRFQILSEGIIGWVWLGVFS